MRQWEKRIEKATRMPKEEEPPLKVFKPVNSNVPVLKEYKGVLGEVAEESLQEREGVFDKP